MNKIKILSTSIWLVLSFSMVISCTEQTKKEGKGQTKEAVTGLPDKIHEKDTIERHETYKGIFPCTDCDGIETKLDIIYKTDAKKDLFISYVLTKHYLGSQKAVYIQEGNCDIQRGLGKDNDATLIILDSDKRGQEQYFVHFSDDKDLDLIQLDQYSKPMFDYKLTQ